MVKWSLPEKIFQKAIQSTFEPPHFFSLRCGCDNVVKNAVAVVISDDAVCGPVAI